jgi:hypothetical protein
MGLFNKEENWWLRLVIVLITLTWLSSLSVMNKEVITERQKLTDSLSYYKLKLDTVQIRYDSLYDEHFQSSHDNGIMELIIDELSSTSKYKELKKDLEKERNSNKYE